MLESSPYPTALMTNDNNDVTGALMTAPDGVKDGKATAVPHRRQLTSTVSGTALPFVGYRK